LLAQAVEAEAAALLASHADKLTEDGRQRLVRHGHLPEREVMTGIGPVAVRCPRVFRWRETGALGMYGRGSRGPTRRVCSICSVVRTRDRVAGAGYACNARQISTPSAAHFLKSHQLLVQKFAADRDRQKSSFNRTFRR
jgi:hypothetical protein